MGRKPAVFTMGGAKSCRFALFPLMLLMLLLLPAGMVAQKAASSSKYIATYKSSTQTLTFKKFVGETLLKNSAWVEDKQTVAAINTKLGNGTIVHIVFDKSFSTYTPTSLSSFFENLTKLETITGLEYLNTEKVTNMRYMFYNCSSLTTIYASSKFVTPQVSKSFNMFYNCKKLKGEEEWTKGKATDKTYAKIDGGYFRDKAYDNRPWVKYADGTLTFRCGYKKTLGENEYELNSGENWPKWFTYASKISKVVFEASFANARPTNCYAWFVNFKNLTQIEGIENLNTENVTSMRDMFNGCSSLTSLDLTNFNTAKVTDMKLLFANCSALESLDLSMFNTENVTSMPSMFNGTAASLALDDDKDFVAYEPFTATTATYSRTMNTGTTWATLCLPFEVSLDNQNFRAFKLLSADDVAETVELEEIETSIAAGTPVIIKMKDGAKSLSISEADKAIAKDVLASETANGNYQLQGIYTQKEFSKDADNHCYIVKGDKLMNPAKLLEATATEFVGSKPFRACMVDNSSAPAAGARMFSISIGGSTTAIKQLESTADSKAEYYDLQSRRLQNLHKGVNIVKRGGKTMKVIIK